MTFEIVYSDGEVVRGSSKEEYLLAPDDEIQFVIIQYPDGSVIKHKGLDEYVYKGEVKFGSWTTPQIFNDLKSRLQELSNLL